MKIEEISQENLCTRKWECCFIKDSTPLWAYVAASGNALHKKGERNYIVVGGGKNIA